MIDFPFIRKCIFVCALAIFLGTGPLAAGESGPVTPERAQEIALAQTGGGEVMDMGRQYRGDGLHYYRLEILGPNGAFHIEIDAGSGQLLQFIRKHGYKGYKHRRYSAPPASPPAPPAGSTITHEQALAIALAQTGGGTVIDSEVDVKKNGRVIYEFEIINNGVEYEIELDSLGNILELKQKGRRYYLPVYPQVAQPSAPAATEQPRLDLVSIQHMAREKIGGGSVTGYKRVSDNGRTVHEVTVVKDNRRYELEIDDGDGTIRERSVKEIDAGS